MPNHLGAGILPYAINNNKLYFLLGRENPGNDPKRNNLFCDFGGGAERNETAEQTALREFTEETMNIFQHLNVRKLLRKPSFKVKNENYMEYVIQIPYSEKELSTYNSMMGMLNKCRRDKKYKSHINKLIPTCQTGMAEKTEMKWFTAEEIFKNKKEMRPVFLKTFTQIIKKLES